MKLFYIMMVVVMVIRLRLLKHTKLYTKKNRNVTVYKLYLNKKTEGKHQKNRNIIISKLAEENK